MDSKKPPFDKGFVLQTTLRNMKKDIDFSSRKTFDRFKDFSDESNEMHVEKRTEIFETLDVLNKMHKLLDDFQDNNKHLFDNNKD
jgi:hypothetical protein